MSSTLKKLERLLRSRDTDLVIQGVELVRSLDDADLWHQLLDGVGFDPEPKTQRWGKSNRPSPTFVPNRRFTGTGPAQVFHDLALLGLVAFGPATEVREAVEALVVRDRETSYGAKSSLTAWPLEWLAAYPNLRRLTLHLPAHADLAGLRACPALEALHLVCHADLASLDGLGQLATLQRLEVRGFLSDTDGIQGSPVQSVELRSRSLTRVTGLGATAARDVILVTRNAIDLAGLRGGRLASLFVDASAIDPRGLADATVERVLLDGDLTEPLPTVPGLQRLTLPGTMAFGAQPDLTWLRLVGSERALPPLAPLVPKLQRLELANVYLDRIDAVYGLTELAHVALVRSDIHDLNALGEVPLQRLALQHLRCRQIDALPRCQLVRHDDDAPTDRLDLSGSPVRSLKGLGHIVGLRTLMLRGCGHLQSLEGLEHSAIEVLDLRYCERLENADAIGMMPQLRVVAVRGTPFHEGNLPPTDAVITMAASPSFDQGPRPRAQRPRRKRIPVPEGQREAWEALLPLLFVANQSGVDRLVAHLAAHGTPEIYAELLKGVPRYDHRGVKGPLAKADEVWRRLVLQRVVEHAPADSADVARLVKGVEDLRMPVHRDVTDLRGLERFTDLRSLRLFGAHLVGLDRLGQLPLLDKLELHGSGSLAGLPVLPALTELDVGPRNPAEDFAWVRRLPVLTNLRFLGQHIATHAGLAGHPTLERLAMVVTSAADLEVITRLPSLRRLWFAGIRVDLPDLSAVPELDELRLYLHDPADLTVWRPNVAKHLHLRVPRASFDLSALGDLQVETLQMSTRGVNSVALPRGLRRLVVSGPIEPAALPPTEVTDLEIRGITGLLGLDRHPKVRRLVLGLILPPRWKLDFSYLAELPLEELVLESRRPIDLESLVGHPTLRRLVLPTSQRDAWEVPDSLLPLVATKTRAAG